LIVLAYIGSYSLGGIMNVYRLHKIVRDVSPQLARRTRGFLIVFTLIIFLGLGTNGVLGALRSQIPPPFSTLLLVVAGATIYTLYPGSRQRISEAVTPTSRWSSRARSRTNSGGRCETSCWISRRRTDKRSSRGVGCRRRRKGRTRC